MLPRVWGFDRCRDSNSAWLDYRVKSITSRLAPVLADWKGKDQLNSVHRKIGFASADLGPRISTCLLRI